MLEEQGKKNFRYAVEFRRKWTYNNLNSRKQGFTQKFQLSMSYFEKNEHGSKRTHIAI